MQYVGQKDSAYADCAPRVMVNACRFYGMKCPAPDTEEWEAVVDFAGCRHGTSVKSVEELAEYFGLRATLVNPSQVVGQMPLYMTVWNPEVGHSLHAVLIVGWTGRIATVVNYRIKEGPLVERLPLALDRQPPKRTDGAINYDLRWGGIHIPPAPNDRCYLLEPA